jgi:hypothetical protein
MAYMKMRYLYSNAELAISFGIGMVAGVMLAMLLGI